MSPASYLTAPPRGAGSSIAPRNATSRTASSIRCMSTAVWAALGFLCFAFAAGPGWVVYQLLQAWRVLRRPPGGPPRQVREGTRGPTGGEGRVARSEPHGGVLQH